MAMNINDNHPLQKARIVQAMPLGENLLVAFSNGTSAVLDGNDIRHLALTSAMKLLTEQDV